MQLNELSLRLEEAAGAFQFAADEMRFLAAEFPARSKYSPVQRRLVLLADQLELSAQNLSLEALEPEPESAKMVATLGRRKADIATAVIGSAVGGLLSGAALLGFQHQVESVEQIVEVAVQCSTEVLEEIEAPTTPSHAPGLGSGKPAGSTGSSRNTSRGVETRTGGAETNIEREPPDYDSASTESFVYTNSKGVAYHLHSKNVVLRGGKDQLIHFFAKQAGGIGTPTSLPRDREVVENPRNGFVTLRKIRTSQAS